MLGAYLGDNYPIATLTRPINMYVVVCFLIFRDLDVGRMEAVTMRISTFRV